MIARHLRIALVLAIVVSCFSQQLPAQTNDLEIGTPPSVSSASSAYRVSGFSVKGLWTGELYLPLHDGDLWTPEKQSEVLQAVHDAFETESSQSYLLSQAGEVGVFYVDVVEEKNESTHTTKLTFRPFRVHMSLTKLGDNTLPIPRAPWPTRYQIVPAPLLALKPTVGVTYDRAFGTAIIGAFQNDLLALPDTLSGRLPGDNGGRHLDARFVGAKSFDGFYQANASLDYSYRQMGKWLQEFSFATDYNGAKEPLAGNNHVENSVGGSVGATFSFASHTRLTINAGFRHADEKLDDNSGNPSAITEIQPNRLLAESLLPEPVGGFLRAALWEDNGWTDHGAGSHQRLVARVGYARDFAIAPNQTIGVELIGGGGNLWGDAPASRRFFGGNSTGQFLYDEASSPSLLAMPNGPLIRSLGEGQGGSTHGGDAFWHANLNLTIPIRRFSFPLIPADEEVRGMLKNGINVSGKSFLISVLKKEGLTHDQAVTEAERTLKVIRPATQFIIDEANFYAVKPLLMFDAGGISGAGQNATWTAAGGGVQLTIVTAKFECGYMFTLSGPTSGERGNLFLRLVFQKLF